MCDGEDSLQVQRQNPLPRLIRITIIALSPVASRVIDKDIKVVLELIEALSKLLAILELIEIGWDGDCAAWSHLIELDAGGFAGFSVAGGNVDFSAVGDVSFGDHTADAFGAAGDEDDLALGELSV